MKTINILGSELRKLRKAASESLAVTAKAVDIDRSHLNKIELGAYKPSLEILNSLLAHFSVEGNKASQLRLMVTEPQVERLVVGSEEEKDHKDMQTPVPAKKPDVQVMFNPGQTPVLYTDSVFVTSNEFGLVLDVAQNIPGNQQNIVARFGMSFDHAKKLVQVMHNHLEKNER